MKISRSNERFKLSGDLLVLSSAPVNGGLVETSRIIVLPDKPSSNSAKELLSGELESGSEELDSTVGLISTSDIANSTLIKANTSRGEIICFIDPETTELDRDLDRLENLIVYFDFPVSPGWLVKLFSIAVEAVGLALESKKSSGIRTDDSYSGSGIDTLVVACCRPEEESNIERENEELFQELFNLIARGINQSLKLAPDRDGNSGILSRLEDRGVTRDRLVDSAFSLMAGEVEDEKELRKNFHDMVEVYSDDPNIHLLVASGFYLEKEIVALGLEDDPGNLVADELIGINIAEYIGGKNALFNFVRYDKEKPGILSELPPFLDDVVGGLIAGVMTKLFEPKLEDS